MTPRPDAMDDATRSRLALEAAGTGVWDWHLPSGELYLSPIWKAQLGFNAEELPNVYKTWETRVHPDDLPGVLARLNAYLDGNLRVFDTEYRMRAKDGGYRWIRARGQIRERDAAGQPVRLIGIHDDITSRKETELALRRSEDKFVNLFELSPDAIGISRLVDGRLVEVNRAFEETTGYRRDELIGTSTLSLWVSPGARAELVARVSRDLDVAAEIHQFRARDGHIIDGLVSIRRIEHAGEPHLLFVVRDISAHTAAEQALRESEARYREAQRIARLGHWSLDASARRFLWWSDEMFDLFGIDHGEGCPVLDDYLARVHLDDRGMIQATLGEALRKVEPFTFRQRIVAAGDAVRHLEVHGVPVLGADGRIERITGTALDVTERVEAARALEDRARETEWLMKSMSNAFIVWGIGYDATGKCNDLRFEYFNDAYARASGLRFADVQGKSIHEVWPGTEPEWFEIYGRVARSGEPEKFERYFASTGGWYACSAYRPWPATDRICVVFDDITERRYVDHALRDSEARWQFALEGAGAGVWDWHIASNALYLAPGWKAQLGYQDHELPNEYDTWALRVHPEDMPGVKVALDDYLSGRSPEYDAEFRMRAKSGDDLWIRARGKIVERDENGAPVRMIGVHDDITARKQTELALQRRVVALTRPLDASEDIQFTELVSLDDIQEIQDLFAEAFGVASLITTPEGVPITRPSHFSKLCGEFIRKNAEGVKRCEHSDSFLGRYNPSGPNIQHCLSAGLCNAGASITVGGHHVANWLIGQVRDETHDDRQIIRFANEIGADADELVSAFHAIPEMPRDQFERVARILYVMANQISTMAYQNVQQARFIAERQRAEQALRREKSFSDALVDGLPGIFYLFDEQGRLMRWNRNFAEITGLSEARLAETPLPEFIVEADRVHVLEKVREVFTKGESFVEGRMRSARGETPTYFLSGIRMRDGGRDYLVGLGIDISARKRVERTLAEREAYLKAILDSQPECVKLLDREGHLLDMNPAGLAMLEADSVEQVRGHSVCPLVTDHDKATFQESVEAVFNGESRNFTFQITTLKGNHRWLETHAVPIWETGETPRVRAYLGLTRDITERHVMDEALRLTQYALDQYSDGVFRINREGRFEYVNHAACENLGYSEAELLTMHVWEIDPDFPEERWPEQWRLLDATGTKLFETRHLRKDGGIFPVEVSANFVRLGEREVHIAYVRDISARKRSENALHLTRHAIDVAALAFEWYDDTGRVIDVNAQCCEDLGYSREEMLRLRLCDIDPDFPAERWPAIWVQIKELGSFTTETTHRRKNGSLFPVVVTANHVEFEGREYIFTYARDVTERNRVERELKATQHAINHASAAFEWINAEGRVVSCNIQAHRALGYERDEFVGLRVWDYDPDMSPERWLTLWDTLRRDGHAMLETHHRRKDGSAFPIEVTANYVVFGDDEYCFAYINDISERRAAEEQLRTIQFAVDHSSVAFEWLDVNGMVISGNIRAYESLGYARDEFIGLNVRDFTPGLTDEHWRAHVEMLRQHGDQFVEGTHRRKDGTVYPIEVRANYVNLGGREYIFSYINDISERKAAEQALRDSQRRLAGLFDFLPDATFAIDTQGVVIAWNRAMEAMSGKSKESVLGKGDRAYAEAFYGHKRPMLVDMIFDDDPSIAKNYSLLRREGDAWVTEDQVTYLYGGRRAALWAKTAPLRDAEGRVTGAVEVIRDITEQKDAERELRFSEERFRSVVSNTPVLIFEFDDEGVFKLSEGRGLMALGMKPGQLVHTSVCEFFHDDSVVCEHIREAIAGKPAQFTARVGKAVFETFFNPVSDARSGRVSVIGVAVDITDRTEREADLQQKTDEMTRFTYTVSHDLKSPLVTIRTFLGFLEQDIHKQDGERIAKDMGFIRNAAERMARLLEELLELSRIGRVVNNPVDTPFGALVHEAVGLVAGRIAERGVEVAIDDPPLLIHGDRPRLVEVFQNLIDNAVKFMGTQAKPRIEIGAEARDGAWVFHVRDNGIGVDERYLHKVFGLFEKLDPNAEGTGIGLTLVKRIIEIHGGRIWVESAGPGQGTCFYFTLDGAAVSRLEAT